MLTKLGVFESSFLKSNYSYIPKSAPVFLPDGKRSASYRSSVRRMEYLLAAPVLPAAISPSQRFMDAHSLNKINQVLKQYGMTAKDLSLFKEIIGQEGDGFLGYQSGSSTVRLFQDLIALIVKQVLQIPIKEDFVFTRVPGDAAFLYDRALDFLNEKGQNIPPLGWDTEPDIRQHILSLNMNLYQSYDAPWDLTPRYFLENTTWTHANVKEIIKPFFASLGIGGAAVDRLWSEALDLLPHDRGYILQFFDRSSDYAFTKEHSYIAYSGGKPHPQYSNHEVLFDRTAVNFPQIRLVMGNASTLNPYSDLSVVRYDGMTDEERKIYESKLSSLLETLSFVPNKVFETRKRLLDLFNLAN